MSPAVLSLRVLLAVVSVGCAVACLVVVSQDALARVERALIERELRRWRQSALRAQRRAARRAR